MSANQSVDRARMNLQVLGYLDSRHHERGFAAAGRRFTARLPRSALAVFPGKEAEGFYHIGDIRDLPVR
jgi:hypothetical protein